MATTKSRVLLINWPKRADEAYIKQVQELADFTIVEQRPHAEFGPVIANVVQEHGPFAACASFQDYTKPTPWPMDESVVGSLVETGCKLFTGIGAGYDMIDTNFLTEHSVCYANTPVGVSVRTADSAAMMIMQALRASSYHESRLRKGLWQDWTVLARDARVSTLGIVGMGRIGQLVSRHMQYFGMKVIYYKRERLSPEQEGGAEYVSFDELLRRSDVVSLHCPLTPKTRHLISTAEFEKMRDGVILVNTSRGPVVDEEALVEAMKNGKVARCALDVFEGEPKVHPYLMESTLATITPHSAAVNHTVERDAHMEVLANLEAFLRTGKPNTPVNIFT